MISISEANNYIVCYDITDPKRLQKVHEAMMGFGEPMQYSVFNCSLTPLGKVEMISRLSELIDPDVDKVMMIDMGSIRSKVGERFEFLGVTPEKQSKPKFVIV